MTSTAATTTRGGTSDPPATPVIHRSVAQPSVDATAIDAKTTTIESTPAIAPVTPAVRRQTVEPTPMETVAAAAAARPSPAPIVEPVAPIPTAVAAAPAAWTPSPTPSRPSAYATEYGDGGASSSSMSKAGAKDFFGKLKTLPMKMSASKKSSAREDIEAMRGGAMAAQAAGATSTWR